MQKLKRELDSHALSGGRLNVLHLLPREEFKEMWQKCGQSVYGNLITHLLWSLSSSLCGVSKVCSSEETAFPHTDHTPSSPLPTGQQWQQHEPSWMDGSSQRSHHEHCLCSGEFGLCVSVWVKLTSPNKKSYILMKSYVHLCWITLYK